MWKCFYLFILQKSVMLGVGVGVEAFFKVRDFKEPCMQLRWYVCQEEGLSVVTEIKKISKMRVSAPLL